ncbi:hypothetical protein [Bacillus solimangrovi]|uniref:Uncharacterized protein n=1 Tax=Bacillus solimangrovi TaxID=1305675 RepID=A0A1E5LFH7_9BACI|nr:hypothetical protein [Bacillus solimangrovi]OEH92831.1 hypothetical protein BFG57_02215 [Bacillus solimangrovi]
MAGSIESTHSTETEQTTIPPRKNIQKKKRIILFSVSIIVWAALVYGGYFIANQYIEKSQTYLNDRISEIEATNEKQVETLNKQLSSVHEEMLNVKSELVFIQEDLALTGESLNGTDKTKSALQERMVALDKQLEELRKSIARLEDASK